jgi:hypothetical protein
MCELGGNIDRRFLSDIAIVLPTGKSENRYLEEATTRKLKDKLASRDVFYIAKSTNNKKSTIWGKYRPKVTLYNTADEAVRHKPSFLLLVKINKWNYLPIPIHAKYSTAIYVEGVCDMSKSQTIGCAEGYYEIFNSKAMQNAAKILRQSSPNTLTTPPMHIQSPEVDINGRITILLNNNGDINGICSTSYLINNIADFAATEIASTLVDEAKKHAGRYINGGIGWSEHPPYPYPISSNK